MSNTHKGADEIVAEAERFAAEKTGNDSFRFEGDDAEKLVEFVRHMAGFINGRAPMTDAEILELAEPFGGFEFGDTQGHKRISFARVIEARARGETRGASPDAASDVEAKEARIEKIAEIIAEELGECFTCGRVWSAWQVGTMSEDDFTPIAETDIPREIAEAIVNKGQA
jgi:hypothetical protein